MKKLRFVSLLLVLTFLFSSALSVSSFATDAFTFEKNTSSESNKITNAQNKTIVIENKYAKTPDPTDLNYDVERVLAETLGMTVKSSEYLYNLDDSADYIYVELEEGGYAILLKDTMELLEYSFGEVPAYKDTAKKYYGGPSQYYEKANDTFVDVISGKSFAISKQSAAQYASAVRESFSEARKNIKQTTQIKLDYSSVGTKLLASSEENSNKNSQSTRNNVNELGYIQNPPITPGTYIANYAYFMYDPMHGFNENGTCASVAVQLLLSYHNYYSDRRIIANEYLNGDNATLSERNPNYCEDPMDMSYFTLGTRGLCEDGSDDENSYFAMIVALLTEIRPEVEWGWMKTGINKILMERNEVLEEESSENYPPINYTVEHWIAINSSHEHDTSGIRAEIDAGRPVIIEVRERVPNEDDIDPELLPITHAVVAYGYQNYCYPGEEERYLGFTAHAGWGSENKHIWFNATWCRKYTTLEIHHTHTYTQYVGVVESTGATEYKCGVCGHRTDEVVNIGPEDRYTEMKTTLLPDNYKEYKVTFSTSGYRTLQTFGAGSVETGGCIGIYNSNGTLLAYDDESGHEYNALLSYNFTAGVTYLVRVSFYSLSEPLGDIKLAIMETGNYSSYESMPAFVNRTADYTGTFALDKVNVFTYKSTTTREITICAVSEDTDTYLYIIDPRSLSPMKDASVVDSPAEDNLYADDYDGFTDAQITKRFDAGVPYLVIVSTYNPSSNMMLGDFCITFD